MRLRKNRRVEPGFAEQAGHAEPPGHPEHLPPEAGTGPLLDDAPAPPAPEPTAMQETVLHAPRLDLPVDQLIDCTIALGLESPLRGDRVLPVTHTLRHVGNKPVHFIGLADDGDWEADRAWPHLHDAAGRHTAGQPHVGAQRNRVFRIRQRACARSPTSSAPSCDVPDMIAS